MLSYRPVKFLTAVCLCLSLTGCAEMFFGVVCVGRIIINPSSKHPAVEFPDAMVAEYYSERAELGEFYLRHYSYEKERVPPGLSLDFLITNNKNQWFILDDSYEWVKIDEAGEKAAAQNKTDQDKEKLTFPNNEQYKLWVKLSGVPQKSGKYKIDIHYPSMPGMCGTSDNIHPLHLKVVKTGGE